MASGGKDKKAKKEEKQEAEKKEARGSTSLDSLKRKREEIRAAGGKLPTAPAAEGGREGLKAALKAEAGAGGDGAGLLKLLAQRKQGAGGAEGTPAAGNKAQLLKRVLEARQSGAAGQQPRVARGGDNVTLEDRRERLRRYIALLEKDKTAG